MHCMSVRGEEPGVEWGLTFSSVFFLFFCSFYLRNLASAECRIRSSVCPLSLLPEAYCSDLSYPWRWGGREKDGGVMQKSLLISHASHASSFFFDRDDMAQPGFTTRRLSCLTFGSRRRWPVRKKSKSQSGFSWSSPSQQFLRWFPDASEESAHPTYSRRRRGANEGRMRAAQRKIKEWRLMMVDEQLPLRWKILKRQVVCA